MPEEARHITSSLEGLATAFGVALFEAERRGDLTLDQTTAISARADEIYNAFLLGNGLEKRGDVYHIIPRNDPETLKI